MQYRYYLIAVLIAAVLGWVENSHGHIEACDGEWHRGGYPQWSGISFSESNYPEILEEHQPRQEKKNRNRKRPPAKRKKSNLVLEHDYMEDDGLLKESKIP